MGCEQLDYKHLQRNVSYASFMVVCEILPNHCEPDFSESLRSFPYRFFIAGQNSTAAGGGAGVLGLGSSCFCLFL
jgi:hypothetical protein